MMAGQFRGPHKREWVWKSLLRLMAPGTPRPALQRYGLAVLLPLVAAISTSFLAQTDRAPFFPAFTAAAVLASLFGGTMPGLLCVAESAAINAVMARPSWTLRVASIDDMLRIIAFALVACTLVLLIGAVAELQRSLDKQRSELYITLRSIADGVIATDARGRVMMMNPAAEQATGYRLADAAGRPLRAVFHIVDGASRAPVENPVERVLQTGEVALLTNHTLLLRPDGTEIAISDSAAPVRDAQGRTTGVVLVFRDVSEATARHNALIRSEKLEAAVRLGATIAHETNNPLEALANLLFLISADDGISDSTRASVELAQAELLRASEASRRTLSFVSFERSLVQVELRRMTDAVLHSYRSRAANLQVQMQNQIPPELKIWAHPDGLQQVASNLVSNALDAMSDTGGVLSITAELDQTNEPAQVLLRFTDTGHGIEPANLDRIFEPFFTTRTDKGTGLGLWLANRVVEEHGGIMSVESGDAGSTFTVSLPVEPPAAGKRAPVSVHAVSDHDPSAAETISTTAI